jgi:hypothetical protein
MFGALGVSGLAGGGDPYGQQVRSVLPKRSGGAAKATYAGAPMTAYRQQIGQDVQAMGGNPTARQRAQWSQARPMDQVQADYSQLSQQMGRAPTGQEFVRMGGTAADWKAMQSGNDQILSQYYQSKTGRAPTPAELAKFRGSPNANRAIQSAQQQPQRMAPMPQRRPAAPAPSPGVNLMAMQRGFY